MAEFVSLNEAVQELVHDGDVVAAEGFSHLIPYAAGHEIVRQQRSDLTLIRMTADLLYDQMIGMGCARKLIFSWSGNPGLGLLPRFRDAVENRWPCPLELEEHSHAGLAAAFVAGASGLPFGTLKGYTGTDLLQHTHNVAAMVCPFTGETVMAVRALNPDIAIIHAQRADRKGNVQLWGVLGVSKEAVLCAKRALVTVEEVCERLEPVPGGIVIPSWALSAIVVAPRGAWPSYAHGYYARDNAFYRNWDSIARDRNTFLEWMSRNVLEDSLVKA